MADKNNKVPENVPGAWYVDNDLCTPCRVCLDEAPDLLKYNDDESKVFFFKQPEGDEEQATATLQTRWDISASPTDWTYATTVPMRLVDNVWQVSWSPGVVAPQLTANESLALQRTWPRRADILDANGAIATVVRVE